MPPTPAGLGHAVRDHRGLLGPRGRGPAVGRLCGGAHWPDAAAGAGRGARGDRHRGHAGHQPGPAAQGVQPLIAPPQPRHLTRDTGSYG